jgi:ATP-dependent DNA helicase RecQ
MPAVAASEQDDDIHAILLKHFGEDPPETCGNCDNCLAPPRVIDATQLAQKLLSAVYRTGQSFGIGHVEKVLTGSSDERVTQRGHDRLSVFGIVGAQEAALLRPVARTLAAQEMLVTTEHGGLALGPAARAVLKGERTVSIAEPPPKPDRRSRRGELGELPGVGAKKLETWGAEFVTVVRGFAG